MSYRNAVCILCLKFTVEIPILGPEILPLNHKLQIFFSDSAFDTYKFFQIGLASILLVTLPIMIGCLNFTQ